MSDDLNLEELLARFGTRPEGAAAKLEGGEDNLNLYVPADVGDLVVRRYEFTPLPRVVAELELVAFLAEHGFPTPAPRMADDGALYVDAGKPVAVFPFVPGQLPASTTTALAAQFGELLARLHVMADGWDTPGLASFDRVAMLSERTELNIELEGGEGFRREMRRYLDEHGDRAGRLVDGLPAGPLHHDLHRLNVIVRDGSVAAVIDFDEVNRAPYMFDMLRTFHYVAQERPDCRLPAPLASALIGAYDAIRPLEDRECAALSELFDLLNMVDAAEFVTDPPPEIESVDECRSLRVYRANRGYDFSAAWRSSRR